MDGEDAVAAGGVEVEFVLGCHAVGQPFEEDGLGLLLVEAAFHDLPLDLDIPPRVFLDG
jgi:hypothetical protein